MSNRFGRKVKKMKKGKVRLHTRCIVPYNAKHPLKKWKRKKAKKTQTVKRMARFATVR